MSKVIFVGPSLDEVGGVSFYCKAIMASYPGDIVYFPFPLSLAKSPGKFIAVLLDFMRQLYREREANVHLNTSLNFAAITRDAFFLLIALSFGRSVVVFIHGWEQSFANSLTGLKQLLFKQLFDRARLLIVLAAPFKKSLHEFGLTTRITVETTCYPPDLHCSRETSTIRSKSLKNGPKILFLSRIVKEKGVFELVDACKLLCARFPFLTLHVAGDGPDMSLLREYVSLQRAEFVRFHGSITGQRKNDLYGEAHLFCLPTYYGEGLPVSILEAMYFGLPVVTTRAGGIDGIFSDGLNGLFVEAGNVLDIASKIEILLTNPQQTESISLYNIAYAERFSSKAVAQRLASLHDSLEG